MQDQLQLLDNYLRMLRPEFYARLQPPLTDNELDDLEKKYKRKLPAGLRMLYKWKNGQAQDCYDAFANNSSFMSLDDALNSAELMTSMIGSDFDIDNWWNEAWIPIFHNGGGDHICIDTAGIFTGRKGQVLEYWHADNDRNVIAPSLESFVSLVNSYYSCTAPAEFDEYFKAAGIEGYPERFVVE
jgi:cell wall assembly regulator SMI1